MRNRIHPERGSSAADFESSPGFTNVQEAWPESESEPNTPDRDEGGHTPRGKPTAVPLLGLPIDSAASDDLQPEPEPEPEPEHRGRAHSQLVGEGQADTVAFGASLHGAVPHSARSSASGFMATPRLTPRGHHADDNHRHPSCATYYAPRNRNHISLFWEEKLLMAVEFVQVFGLMRMLSQTWTWPPFWRRWTRWAVLFNLDLPAFRYADFDDCPPSFAECSASCRSCPSCVADGALCECEAEAAACDAACQEAGDTQPALNLTMCIAGLSGGDPEAEITLDQRPGTSWPMYAAVWLGVVGVLVLGGAYARLSLRRKHSHRRAYYRLTYACLVLSEILYLPALLALPRMFVCAVPFDELFPSITEVGNPYTNHGGAALFASPPLCGSALHALTRCLALAVFLPLLLGFPLTQFNITRRQLVYAEDIAHEMFLRSRELEYLLGLNHHWGAFHYHTFASFQRASAYAKAYSSGGKIVLASTVFMGSGGVGATTAILTVLCLGQLSALVWPRYRCSSSRAVHKTLGWCAICNIGSGWLLSLGVRSFFLVDSHLQYYLIGLNALGAAFIVLELLTSMCCACRRKPSKYASAETRLGTPPAAIMSRMWIAKTTNIFFTLHSPFLGTRCGGGVQGGR